MSTQKDSVLSMELQPPGNDDNHDDFDNNRLPTWQAFFMLFRSFVGIGVLTMPHSVQAFGVNGSVVFFVIFAAVFLYVLDLVIRIAIDLGYTGSR